MNEDEQRALVFEHLRRREQIAAETRQQLSELSREDALDPLAGVAPSVREAAEAEFYASMGRSRYKTSDGRILYLTPEEIAQRRRARTQRRPKRKARGNYYGVGNSETRNRWVNLGFNVGAIGLALVLVYLILH